MSDVSLDRLIQTEVNSRLQQAVRDAVTKAGIPFEKYVQDYLDKMDIENYARGIVENRIATEVSDKLKRLSTGYGTSEMAVKEALEKHVREQVMPKLLKLLNNRNEP